MRKYVFILFILLILWITGSAYWYVCRIREDCKSPLQEIEYVSPDTQGISEDNAQTTEASALQASVEEAKAYLISSGIQKVHFETSSSITDISVIPAEYLNKLKLYLDNHPETKINVTGHTDNTGTEAFNYRLGTLRAEFVKSFLINSGINTDQIQTSSKAYNEPAAPNHTREGRARNRRTEINILI